MNKIAFSSCLMVLLIWVSTAHGASFVFVTADSHTSIFADVESVKVKGSIAKCWFENRFENTGTSPENVKSYMAYEEYDCSEGKTRTLQITTYFVGGHHRSEKYDKPEWQYIVPNTIGDTMYRFVCKQIKQKGE